MLSAGPRPTEARAAILIEEAKNSLEALDGEVPMPIGIILIINIFRN